MGQTSPSMTAPPLDDWEDCRQKFIAACRMEPFPTVATIRDWVLRFPAEAQPDLAVDLAISHLLASWQCKRGMLLEEYVRELGPDFAEFRSLGSLPIELVETEFVARHEFPAADDLPSIEHYAQRFPDRDDVQECIRAKSLDNGRYVLTRFIGAGGLGRVWSAYDRHLRRPVAIKLPRSGLSGGRRVREMFEGEGRITAGLEHPSILTVHEMARADEETPYAVMRLVGGRTLHSMIREYHLATRNSEPRSRSLMWNELLRHFITVCNALAYAHQRGVIHRDLKPQNVMVGAFGEAVVVDWGLATTIDGQTHRCDEYAETNSSESTSRSGEPKGTDAYMSPEQLKGKADIRSDIFGLGTILYSILSGRAPYVLDAGEDHAAYRSRIESARYPFPRTVNAAVPRSLEAVCLKAMSYEPQARYDGASALAEEVARFLVDEPVSAYHEPPHVRIGRWIRRHRTLVVSVGMMSLVAVPLLAYGYVQERQARRVAQGRGDLALATVEKIRKVITDDELMRQPTMAAPREQLLAIQTDFYEELRAQLDSDRGARPEDREQLANACESHASILAVTGAKDRAIALYQKALAIRETIDRAPAQRNRGLARVQAELGLLLSEVGPEQKAAEALMRSIDLGTALHETSPDDVEIRQELARSWADLGILRRDHGQPAQAETAFENSRKMLETQPAKPSAAPNLRIELGRTLLNRAILRGEFGRPIDALADAVRSRDLAFAQIQHEPGDVRARTLLGRALDRVGVLQAETGRLQEASASIETASEVRRGLVNDQPLFADFRDDLAATLGNLSNIQTARHDEKAAQSSLDEAGRLLKELTERYGSVVRYQDDLASYHHSVAGRHIRNGDVTLALESLAKARTIREGLLLKDARLAPVRAQLAKTLYNEAKLRFRNNQPDEAFRRLGGVRDHETGRSEPTALQLVADLVGESPRGPQGPQSAGGGARPHRLHGHGDRPRLARHRPPQGSRDRASRSVRVGAPGETLSSGALRPQ